MTHYFYFYVSFLYFKCSLVAVQNIKLCLDTSYVCLNSERRCRFILEFLDDRVVGNKVWGHFDQSLNQKNNWKSSEYFLGEEFDKPFLLDISHFQPDFVNLLVVIDFGKCLNSKPLLTGSDVQT